MVEDPGQAARQPDSPTPWTLMPSAWLMPGSAARGAWRREVRLAPRPLTPYSAHWVKRWLPELCRKISQDLALPNGGVELRWVEGHLYARPLPARGWFRWLPLQAARFGWRANQRVRQLVRGWETGGLTALLADVAELRLRVVAEETAAPGEWPRVLERAAELWVSHLHRLLEAEALATLLRWQLQGLLEAFGLVQQESIHADRCLAPPALVAEITHRLGQLARLGSEEPLRHLWTGGTAGELRRRLAQVLAEPAQLGGSAAQFAALWGQFLSRFGHLAWPAPELAAPPWAEDPRAPLQMLAGLIQDAPRGRRPASTADHGAARQRQEAAARIAQRLQGRPWDLRRLQATLRLAEAAGQLAAEMGYHTLQLRLWWRRAVLGAGRALAAAGTLAAPEQVWFLTPEEVLAALAGGPGPASAPTGSALQARVGERRQRWRAAASSAPQDSPAP